MINLYTQLITNINRSVDPIEKGDEPIGKARHAKTVNNATNATTADVASKADLASKADNTTSADRVDAINEPPTITVSLPKGGSIATATCGALEAGVYIAEFRCDVGAAEFYAGVLVVKPGKKSWCRITSVSGWDYSALSYDGNGTLSITEDEGFPASGSTYELSRTIYLYKIGTLEQEG